MTPHINTWFNAVTDSKRSLRINVPPKAAERLNSLSADYPEQHAILDHILGSSAKFKEGATPISGPFQIQLYDSSSEIPYRIIGIAKSDLTNESVVSARGAIFESMGLPADHPVIQVIGDSAVFGCEIKSKAATKFVDDMLTPCIDSHAVLYGLTGKRVSDRSEVNNLVSEWLADTVKAGKTPRVIGNAVDGHTPIAMVEWGCSIGDVRDIWLVHSSDYSAVFGDDAPLSDYIMKTASTKRSFGIVLEGGIQSLAQMINMLDQDIEIHALQGLRDADNSHFNIKEKLANGSERVLASYPFLSATEFLWHIQQTYIENPSANEEDIVNAIYNYVHNPYLEHRIPKNAATRVYANPDRADYPTKLPLWDKAINLLIENQLWKKLPKLLHLYEQTGASYTKISSAMLGATDKPLSGCGIFGGAAGIILATSPFKAVVTETDSELTLN